MIRIHAEDNVAVATETVHPGEIFEGVSAAQEIPGGHKMALARIPAGADVIKYGLPIGHALRDILPGEWVHTHNVGTNLGAEGDYVYAGQGAAPRPAETECFQGYRRKDGRAATRNEIWIVPTVGCVNDAALAIAERGRALAGGSVDGVYAFIHPYGCSQTGEDHACTRRLLAALASHPNAGCENLSMEQFRSELGDLDSSRIAFLLAQDVPDEVEVGAEILRRLARRMQDDVREPIPMRELVVGMKCGGSDGLSGITANPVIGRFTDMLTAMGGSAILTEVPEMFGAEAILLNHCANRAVFEDAVKMIDGFRRYFVAHGQAVYENPSPGNRAGGITTLEDKSCGCIQKGGSAQITDVLAYGQRVRRRGLSLLNAPGNDMVSATALAAAGAHLILFSTGRGTPFGAPVPTLKISSNTALYEKKPAWIDFDAGTVVHGESVASAAGRLMRLAIQVAGGAPSCCEKGGRHGIAIWKNGITL